MLKQIGLARADIAKELDWYRADLDALVFGLVLAGIDGGGTGPRTTQSRASLRLVAEES